MRNSPYTPQQLMNYERCGCDPKSNMSVIMKIADEQAEQKLTGGFRRFKKNGERNVCTRCFTTKSVNGTCGCE